MDFLIKIKILEKPQPVIMFNGVEYRATQYQTIAIKALNFDEALRIAKQYASGKPIISISRQSEQ